MCGGVVAGRPISEGEPRAWWGTGIAEEDVVGKEGLQEILQLLGGALSTIRKMTPYMGWEFMWKTCNVNFDPKQRYSLPDVSQSLDLARKVFESIYRTRATNSRQAPLSSLRVPFFSLKTPLNRGSTPQPMYSAFYFQQQ